MYQIEVIVAQDGTATVKAVGFEGPSCALKTRPFLDAIGQVVADAPTAEMYAVPLQTQELHQ